MGSFSALPGFSAVTVNPSILIIVPYFLPTIFGHGATKIQWFKDGEEDKIDPNEEKRARAKQWLDKWNQQTSFHTKPM